jgi:hypothetical protein
MKTKLVMLAFGLCGLAAPAVAHHSIGGEYDQKKPVEMSPMSRVS